MQYQEAKEAFFTPPPADSVPPPIVSSARPARRLRDAFEPIAMHGVWAPLVHERMAERDMDFFRPTYGVGPA